MRITFSPAKRAWTLDVRGLDFLDFELVLGGERITWQDQRKDYGEARFLTFGWLHDELVATCWTPRLIEGGQSIHVISMRRANAREKARFEDRLGKGQGDPRSS